MKDLKDIRAEIDAIDDELARLFARRLEIVGDVAASKVAHGAAVTDPARERAILSRMTEEVGVKYENGARLFFSTLFGISKARQRMMMGAGAPILGAIEAARATTAPRFPNRAVVACVGAEGSYAQQAVSLLFPLPTILYFNQFEKVCDAVEKGLCPYGVVAIENSLAGSVAAVYDTLMKRRFHIARSIRLKVDHVLLAPRGVTLADIREVTSHPHALAQCGAFLTAHPGLVVVPGANTAVAAKALASSDRRDAAVIASRACAELYGLDVIAEDIADTPNNYTRFICLSRDMEIYPDANRFTVMMALRHRPGALSGVLAKFAAIGVNLTKLESRPIAGMDFEVRFIIDFEATPGENNVRELLAELSQDPDIEHFTFLGAYAEK